MSPTLMNQERLFPCALCRVRMAVPGSSVCTMCDAVTIPEALKALKENW